ncbi:MAG: M3 family oligoendopeptidase, partial [Cyclobacteriaceae bacterium]
MALTLPARPARHFLPEEFQVSTWEQLKPYFDQLQERTIDSRAALERWLRDRSELESVLSEDLGWRYIRMTCYTESEEHRKAYQDFIENIQPQMAPVADRLNKKMAASPFLNELSDQPGYAILIRNV